MAFRAPLLGYNTNVRHKGKLYHIQTEDSGVDHPHVITHLFADGGRIVASKKTSYADRVGSDGLQDVVKKVMQAQHKAMFVALREGLYDENGPHDAAAEQTGTRAVANNPTPTPELEPTVALGVAGVPERAPPAQAAKPAVAAAADKPKVAKPVVSPARSLFGGDLLNEKSLDEVILSYLAANEKDG